MQISPESLHEFLDDFFRGIPREIEEETAKAGLPNLVGYFFDNNGS